MFAAFSDLHGIWIPDGSNAEEELVVGILKVHEHARNKLSTHVVVNCLQKQMLFA